jgi:beta-galactosidase
VTDDRGRVVPVAGNLIDLDLAGPGRILGVGNGDPSCHEPDTYIPEDKTGAVHWKRSAFNGLAQVIVQAGKDAGTLHLTAQADGLTGASIDISSADDSSQPLQP